MTVTPVRELPVVIAIGGDFWLTVTLVANHPRKCIEAHNLSLIRLSHFGSVDKLVVSEFGFLAHHDGRRCGAGKQEETFNSAGDQWLVKCRLQW